MMSPLQTLKIPSSDKSLLLSSSLLCGRASFANLGLALCLLLV